MRILGKEMSKWIVLPAMLIMLSGIGLATWAIFIQDSSTVKVNSIGESPIFFSTNFASGEINVMNSSQTFNDSAVIYNRDGELDLIINFNVTKTDNETDSCDQFQDDCTVVVTFNGAPIEDGYEFTFISDGSVTIGAETTCERLSCPQEVITAVTVSGQ